MRGKNHVAVRMTMLLLPGLLYALPAMSEGERESKRPASGSVLGPKVWPAPVGHRQPTLADIPKDASKNPAEQPRDKRDREIDALLQICRDC